MKYISNIKFCLAWLVLDSVDSFCLCESGRDLYLRRLWHTSSAVDLLFTSWNVVGKHQYLRMGFLNALSVTMLFLSFEVCWCQETEPVTAICAVLKPEDLQTKIAHYRGGLQTRRRRRRGDRECLNVCLDSPTQSISQRKCVQLLLCWAARTYWSGWRL